MNLQCQSCQAEYAVPESALGERHTVRCSACDHSWTIGNADPDEDGADPEAVAEDDDPGSAEPMEDAQDQPAEATPVARLSPPLSPSPAPNRWLAAAWLASVSAIAACVVAACLYQTRVVAAWPPAGRLFAANHAAPVEPLKTPKPDSMVRPDRAKP